MRTLLSALLGVLLLAMTHVAHAAQCSTRALAGTWDFYMSGTALLAKEKLPFWIHCTAPVSSTGVISAGDCFSFGGFGRKLVGGNLTLTSQCQTDPTAKAGNLLTLARQDNPTLWSNQAIYKATVPNARAEQLIGVGFDSNSVLYTNDQNDNGNAIFTLLAVKRPL